jgi:hypothetical protein
MQTSTAFAPAPQPEFRSEFQSDSFASFLARLAELPGWDSDINPAQSSEQEPDILSDFGVSEDELATLSYEHALRAPSRVQPQSPKRAAKTSLETRLSPTIKPSPAAIQIADSRRCRTTIRLTAAENELLHTRAAESGLAVSAYIRSCVLEVESLRAQVKQMMTEMRSTPACAQAWRPAYSVTAPQTPALPAQPAQPALAAPQTPRPLQPLTARAPQPGLKLDPRVQAAFDAQKRLSAQSAPKAQEKARTGLLGFLFGTRKSA